jgi:hypothetical protein
MLMSLTHYSAVSLPAAQFLVLLFNFRANRGLLQRWIGAYVIALLPLSVWIFAFFRHAAERGGGWVPIPQVADIFITIWSMTLGYDGSMEWYVIPGFVIVAAGLILSIGYTIYRARNQLDNTYWLLLILSPLIPVFAYSIAYHSIYVDRYFMVFLPALLFLIIKGWFGLPRLLAHAALLALIIIGAANILTAFNRGTFRRSDWEQVAEYVSAEYEDGDFILLERFNTRRAFSRYLSSDDLARMPIAELSEDFDGSGAARIWVVYRNPIEDIHRQGEMPEFDPFAADLSPMGDWLIPRRDAVVLEQEFNGVTILLLDYSGQ